MTKKERRKTNVRGHGQVKTIGNGVGENLGQIPTIRSHRRQDTVDGESHDGTVVEKRNDKNHEWRELELVTEREDGEADDDTDGDGASVDGVVTHTLEDDTRTANGVDDGGETGLSQDDIGGTTGSVSGTLDGDTDVGTRQGRSVVSTVTSHGAKVTKTLERETRVRTTNRTRRGERGEKSKTTYLETLDNLELVLGEHTSETIGIHDHLVESTVLASGLGTILEDLSGVHVVAETETTASLLRNST